MRFSHLFGRTLRETPADAELISHQLCLRAGLIRPLASGIYSYLPLGWRVMQRLAAIIREEMDAIGGQELAMPLVHPAELWKATGRYDAPSPGEALVRFQDRSSHAMVLGMTHEEVIVHLARHEIRSYRQLPLMVYQIQTKFRDEPRARGGLLRVREFLMQDAYTFDADEQGLAAQYRRIYAAYERILARCGVTAMAVEAADGMMGGLASREFIVLHEQGEDTLILCDACSYAANAEAATFDKGRAEAAPLAEIAKVATPGTTTIEAVARFLGVETRQTLKAVFYSTAQDEVLFVVIRGDLEVNEAKLAALLGDGTLKPAGEEALRAAGLVPGYASPVGLSGVRVIADDSITSGHNFVAGANEAGYHLVHVNYPRDFAVDMLADIALARQGDPCPRCGAPLRAARGIAVGHIFKLGTRYSEAIGALYLDREGQARPLVMGSYGIGLGHLLACIIEQHHDAYGIIWPPAVAPFQVHLVSLGGADSEVAQAAEDLYRRLQERGYTVLYDDRDERPGVKFNDADLIGAPVRLTVSQRTLKERGVEFKLRWERARRMVPDAEVEREIEAALGNISPLVQMPQAC